MAAIAVEAVVAAVELAVDAGVTAGVEAAVACAVEVAVEAGVEATVETAIEAGVEAMVEKAIELAISLAIEKGIEAGIEAAMISNLSNILKKTIVTSAVETALSPPVADQLRRCYANTVSKIGAEVMRQLQAAEEELFKTFNSSSDTGATLVKKVLDDYSGRVLKQVLPDVVKALMGKVKEAVKAAGEEAKQFTKDTGKHIMLISLIPFYGWVEGPIELANMKELCMSHFHDLVHSKVMEEIKEYQPNMKAVTQAAKKMANSKEFKDALTAAVKSPAEKRAAPKLTAGKAKKARLSK